MNRFFCILIILLTFISSISCKKKHETQIIEDVLEDKNQKNETSSNSLLTKETDPFPIILENDKAYLMLYNNLNFRKYEVMPDWRDLSLSGDRKYLLFTYGTDVVGGLEIYNLLTLDRIVEMSYKNLKENWIDNLLNFETVLWTGNGYSIKRQVTFNDGKIYYGKQSVGGYHSDARGDDPLSAHYKWKTNSYVDLVSNIGIFVESRPMLSPYISLLVFPEKNDTQANNLISYINNIYEALNSSKEQDLYRYYGSDIFCMIYELMEAAYKEKIISKDIKDAYTIKYLLTLNIDQNIVPWLLQ